MWRHIEKNENNWITIFLIKKGVYKLSTISFNYNFTNYSLKLELYGEQYIL